MRFDGLPVPKFNARCINEFTGSTQKRIEFVREIIYNMLEKIKA